MFLPFGEYLTELLKKLYIQNAAAVILTMDHTAAAVRTVKAIRK